MHQAKYSPQVKFHNIIGALQDPSFLQRRAGVGDGIVALASARVGGVESELLVDSEHTTVHMIGKSIYEVRRILLQHMHEIDSQDRVALLDTSDKAETDKTETDTPDSTDNEVESRLVPVTLQR